MTKQERMEYKEKLKELLFDVRALGGKRYEEIAVESGVSIDTIRRLLYAKGRLPGQITIKKLMAWLERNGIQIYRN